MRKYSVAIFFPVLFLLAYLTPGLIPVGKTATLSSAIAANNSFGTDLNYPHSEIENCNVQGSTALQGSQGLQKIPGYLAYNAKARVISSLLFTPVTFPFIELFDNNYLSHNYPSHNFW